MDYSPEAIAEQLAAATAEVDQAEARLYEAEALEKVTSRPGLHYAPTVVDQSVYVVACDGRPLGHLWRGPRGGLLGGWTATTLGSSDRLGPFPTPRAAAVALAAASATGPAT